MVTFISFIVVLGVLIFFHELGHFLAARLMGVGVEKFSLGFGPMLIGKKIGITQYRISVVPLGGYVKMVGDDPDSDEEPEDISISFTHKPIFARALIVAAGPIFNLVLSWFLFFCLFMWAGVNFPTTFVGKVMDDSPAQRAGILSGDEFIFINGEKTNKWEDVSRLISQNKGKPLEFLLKRDGHEITVNTAAEKITEKDMIGEEFEYWRVGITPEWVNYPHSPVKSTLRALNDTWLWCKLTVRVIYKIFDGTVSPKNLGGPILIAKMSGESAKAGLSQFMFFMAILSVNLGIINLFPIPILDGGHLVFLAIEGVRRRPLSIKAREIAQQMGLAMLILLMILVFYNDIARLLAGPAGAG